MTTKKEKAYWEFHARIGTDNATMLTKDIMKKVIEKLREIPEVVNISIKEQYGEKVS